jgi:NADPH:quinone reductase-like Zn-dependent oxidoreductase
MLISMHHLLACRFVVAVPKQVDGAQAACLIRLYMTAFQSIELGIVHTTTLTHDRYNLSQLGGKSLLIQNGHTEVGLAVIEVAIALGAHEIFATAPSEFHSKIRNAGATPLGDQTFSWELFLTEKLSLVLLQDKPSAEDFDHYLNVLDVESGSIVKINRWPQHQIEEDNDGNLLATEGGGCDGGLHTVTQNIRDVLEEAKFAIRLACCSPYVAYDGVWSSSKEDPTQWKEDLRFLFALLAEGKLSPRVHEQICLEDVGKSSHDTVFDMLLHL